MYKSIFLLFIALSLGCHCIYSQQSGKWGDQLDGTFRNPVIAGDFSDPDPIRVGDDYYMVSSTFESLPGVTILHSSDLVNWSIIGSVFHDLSAVDNAFSTRQMNRYNRGVYAPCIRYHNGLFWIFVNFKNDGFWMANASHPSGPWNIHQLKDKHGKPLRTDSWTDPCPFWDHDGKAYLISSRPGKKWYAYLFEMSPDGTQLLDAEVEHMNIRNIVYEYPKGGTLISPYHSTEGNKIYKRNGYYYYIHIEFLQQGQGEGTCLSRSKHLYGTQEDGTPGSPGNPGKYEVRRIDRFQATGYKQELPGQGGLVDTPDGRWFWIAQFNRYNSDGRTPCLLPVTWKDDWPIIGDSIDGMYGKMVWQMKKPIMGGKVGIPHGSDEFADPDLKKFWAWNHQPQATRWSLTDRKGHLRSTLGKKESFFKAGNTINQRHLRSDTAVVTIKLDISGMEAGQKGGLCHFNGGKNYSF